MQPLCWGARVALEGPRVHGRVQVPAFVEAARGLRGRLGLRGAGRPERGKRTRVRVGGLLRDDVAQVLGGTGQWHDRRVF